MRMRLVLISLLIGTPLSADPPSAVKLDDVKYPDLIVEVKGLKGKVVLVDVWGTFCAPCREKFPAFVRMHNRYARDGLAVVSVSVDAPEDRAAVREFLAEQKAAFRNVLLTDKAEVWQAAWKAEGPPVVFLFDRAGRLAARWDDKIDPGKVEKRVEELLAE